MNRDLEDRLPDYLRQFNIGWVIFDIFPLLNSLANLYRDRIGDSITDAFQITRDLGWPYCLFAFAINNNGK